MVEIEDGWENRWVKSDWKKYEKMAGEWNHTSGKWNGDPNDKGSFSPPRCKHFLILMMLLKALLLISKY